MLTGDIQTSEVAVQVPGAWRHLRIVSPSWEVLMALQQPLSDCLRISLHCQGSSQKTCVRGIPAPAGACRSHSGKHTVIEEITGVWQRL